VPSSERLFREAFDRAEVGIAAMSLQGRFLRFNQRFCDIVGYGLEELAALTFQDITYPDDRDATSVYFQRLLAGDMDAFDLDERCIRKDGQLVWVHPTVALVRTRVGAPGYIFATLQDITERRRLGQERAQLLEQERSARTAAEAALARAVASEAEAAERAERLRAILETMADGVLVYDRDGRIIQSNRAFRELVAMDRFPVYETLSLAERIHRLNIRDAVTGEPRPLEGIAGMRALRGEVVTGPEAEDRVRAFDGRELELNLSAAPLRDGEGRIVGAVSVVRDITWRRLLEREREAALARATASEAEAAERAERLRAILETMADGVGVYDQVGRIVQCNRAYRELLAAGRIPGFDAIPLADRAPLFDMRDAATGEPLPLERFPVTYALRGETATGPIADIRIRALDGRELEANISAAPLRDLDGHVVGAVSVLHDVTWRRLLEREREAAQSAALALRQTTEHMDDFIATAAHDLRTPIGAMVGYIDLAGRKCERIVSPDLEASSPGAMRQIRELRGYLDQASQGATRTIAVLNRILATAQGRTGEFDMHPMPRDLTAIVRGHVDDTRMVNPRRTIRLEAPGDAPVMVQADAGRIGEVVANYLTNALKYSADDEPVDVRITVEDSSARVAVSDHGPGLPSWAREHIWERFYRAPGISVRSGTNIGLGLGLYICKLFVERHGGQVGVESELGRGSTFWFSLPLATEASPASPSSPATP
jgi:PAS domain S-box-containing protein